MKYYKSENEIIKFSGKDSLDFLQRLSTNDCKKINENEILQTCLLNEKGKLIALLNISNYENNLFAMIDNGLSEIVINHLNKFIILEDVKIEKVNNIEIYILINNNEIDSKFIFKNYFNWQIILEFDKRKIDLNKYSEIDKDEYEKERIFNGRAVYPNEINNNYSPFDINLSHTISFTKGCYLGQEVIARIDTYKKNKWNLVLLKSDKMNEAIIFINKVEIGKSTSYIFYENKYLYLAIININYINNEMIDNNGNLFILEKVF